MLCKPITLHLTRCQCRDHTGHNIISLLIHLVHIHLRSILEPLSTSILATLFLHCRTVPVERERREASLAALAGRDEDALTVPSRGNGSGHSSHGGQCCRARGRTLGIATLLFLFMSILQAIQIDNPPGVQSIPRRFPRMSHGRSFHPIRSESLFVIPRQSAMADDASVGEDELAEGSDVKPMRGNFGLVGLVKIIVFVFHGGIFPLSFITILVILNILPSIIFHFHRSSRLLRALTQKFFIGLTKIIKHIKFLLIHTPLIQNLTMPFVPHVFQHGLGITKGFLTVQTQIPPSDLFVAITQ
mmetsp:Transcript_14166/g.22583  ORF Transcript_14166/g.22583 Transcript_14166/m.22583 type:complete len:301 (-) Transcript_14166:143-1045(-)